MNRERNYFYCDKSDEYHFVNRTLVRKTDNGIKEIFEFEDSGLEEKSYSILFLEEFEGYRVLMFNWVIPRNVICLRRETDEVLWRIDPPIQRGKRNPENYWTNMGPSELYRDAIVCASHKNYKAIIDLETKSILKEINVLSNDPRDF